MSCPATIEFDARQGVWDCTLHVDPPVQYCAMSLAQARRTAHERLRSLGQEPDGDVSCDIRLPDDVAALVRSVEDAGTPGERREAARAAVRTVLTEAMPIGTGDLAELLGSDANELQELIRDTTAEERRST